MSAWLAMFKKESQSPYRNWYDADMIILDWPFAFNGNASAFNATVHDVLSMLGVNDKVTLREATALKGYNESVRLVLDVTLSGRIGRTIAENVDYAYTRAI